jgi:hypothetical protein
LIDGSIAELPDAEHRLAQRGLLDQSMLGASFRPCAIEICCKTFCIPRREQYPSGCRTVKIDASSERNTRRYQPLGLGSRDEKRNVALENGKRDRPRRCD